MKSNKKHWKEYFQDTTHKTLSLGRLFVRTLPKSRKSAIEKEFHAQKCLSATNLVPKPYFKFLSNRTTIPSFVIEENISFTPVYKKTNKFIIQVGKTLRELHDCSRDGKEGIFKVIPPDPLLVNGTYDPLVILRIFITDPLKKIKLARPKLITPTVKENLKTIEDKVRLLNKQTVYKSEYNALIHGDLNDTNIVRKENGGIAYLDWADCRWDIATCDIAQFIYLHRLNKNEQEIFLMAYSANWITKEMTEIHRLLLIGWDIIYLMTINLDIPEDKIERLLPIKERIWDKQKILI